jgi:hypothetical protein
MSLENALKKSAHKVWDELEPVTGYTIFPPREEALTSMMLKILARENCSKVMCIEMVGSKTEKKHGYDFELIIGSSKTNKKLRLAIQAKRLYNTTIESKYNAYDPTQPAKLMQYAKDNRAMPMYALYNHLICKANLKAYYNSQTCYDKKNLGITLCTLEHISNCHTKDNMSFHKIHYSRVSRIKSLLGIESDSYKKYKSGLFDAIPLHQMSYINISEIEKINKYYLKNGKLPEFVFGFFFFFLPWFQSPFNPEEVIPLISNTTEELIEGFRSKQIELVENDDSSNFVPRALIIIETD